METMHVNERHTIGNGGNKATSSGNSIYNFFTYHPSNKGDLDEKHGLSCKAVRANFGNESCAPATSLTQSCSQRRLGWHDAPAGTVRKENVETFTREVLRKRCPDEIVITPLPPGPSRFQKLFPDRGGVGTSEERDKKEPAQEAAQEAAGACSMKYRADLVVMSVSQGRGVQDTTTGARTRCPWREQDGTGGSTPHSQPSQNWHLDDAPKMAGIPNTVRHCQLISWTKGDEAAALTDSDYQNARRRFRPKISLWLDDEDHSVDDPSSPAPTTWVGIGTGPGNRTLASIKVTGVAMRRHNV